MEFENQSGFTIVKYRDGLIFVRDERKEELKITGILVWEAN